MQGRGIGRGGQTEEESVGLDCRGRGGAGHCRECSFRSPAKSIKVNECDVRFVRCLGILYTHKVICTLVLVFNDCKF